MLKCFSKDDFSGKPSDTTKRAWIVFLFAVADSFAIRLQSFLGYTLTPNDVTLNQTLWFAAAGFAGVYLGKRINEAYNGGLYERPGTNEPSTTFPAEG